MLLFEASSNWLQVEDANCCGFIKIHLKGVAGGVGSRAGVGGGGGEKGCLFGSQITIFLSVFFLFIILFMFFFFGRHT